MAPRGWRKQPGSAERYKPPAGSAARFRRAGKLRADGTVSRRTFENERVAQKGGWRSWSEYQRVAKTQGYRQAMTGAKRKGQPTGPLSPLGKATAGTRRERERFRQGKGPDPNRPDGPLADYLVYQGRRDPEASYRVGETPKRK